MFWVAVVCLLVATTLQLVFARVTGGLVDGTLASIDLEVSKNLPLSDWPIYRIGLFLGVTILMLFSATFFEMNLFYRSGEKAAARLRMDLFSHLVGLPVAFFDRVRAGELSSRVLADVAMIQELWVNDVRQIIKFTVLALGAVLMMFVTSARLSMFVFVLAPPVVLLAVVLGRSIRSRTIHVQEKLAGASVILDESLQGIRSVKAFSNERYESRRFQSAIMEFLTPALSLARFRAVFVSGILVVMLLAGVFLMWYGSRQIQLRRLTPGEFTSYMFFLGFAGSSGAMLADLAGKIYRMLGAAGRVAVLLREPAEKVRAASDQIPESELSGRLKGTLEFRNVSFCYPSRPDAMVMSDLSLKVGDGRRVALVGPSGSGKSTLVSLLFGLYQPDSGEIWIGGRPATGYPLSWLREHMALVPQEVLLFGGSVAENIAYGRPGASHEEIVEAARQANCLEFIKRLPREFETPLGDRGVQVSGGQRQRIAIARAILRDPAILVLDEATSSLDSENERLVRNALGDLMKNRTSLIIAHRLSTVQEVDEIFVMRDGKIVDRGRHSELYDRDGYYRTLCQQALEGLA